MAGTLLHVTLADRILERSAVDSALRDSLARERDSYRLGAVLVDLPYYDRLWLNGLRTALGGELRFAAWGTLLHVRSPVGLLLALLDRADSPGLRALALGAVTHQAVDVTFHPAICRREIAVADGSAGLDTVHKRIEDQLDLHAHYDLLGHPGVGRRYAREALALRPDPAWAAVVAAAIGAVHGGAPSPARLRRWLVSLRLFGWASSTRLAPWVETLPADDPELQQQALELTDEAIRVGAGYLEAGAEYLAQRIDAAGFRARVPDRSILDGEPAAPPR